MSEAAMETIRHAVLGLPVVVLAALSLALVIAAGLDFFHTAGKSWWNNLSMAIFIALGVFWLLARSVEIGRMIAEAMRGGS